MARTRPIPTSVREAIARGHTERLRAMGRAGGRKSAEARRRRSDEAAIWDARKRERAAADEQHRRQSANEHILSIDPGEDE